MMFFILSIGIYAFSLFFLGLGGLLKSPFIESVTGIFACALLSLFWSSRLEVKRIFMSLRRQERKTWTIFGLITLLVIVNLVGSLGPETSFDALWYHLTLPKIYLLDQRVNFIPGGLLYYSAMPQLGEMLFSSVLFFTDEIGAKVLQFLSSILIGLLIYVLSRRYMNAFYSALAVLIFLSNIAVAWESTIAYIDLIRTVFELAALFCFITWTTTDEKKYFFLSGIFLGFTISTKLLGLGTLGIFTALMFYHFYSNKQPLRIIAKNVGLFLGIALVIPLPFFIYTYIHTGNPFYPFFTDHYPTTIHLSLLYPSTFFKDVFTLFTASSDPISPLYLIVTPLLLIWYKKFPKELRLLLLYSLFALCAWYVTPRTGGGRFIIPYLPAFSLVTAYLLFFLNKQKNILRIYSLILLTVTLLLAITTFTYRSVANSRYIPVILGTVSKDEYLTTHLNFSFGDFYDTDGYFKSTIQPTDNVLLYGFHNLYYVHFPFIDSSWVRPGDTFNYVAVQNGELPQEFSNWDLIYHNKTTNVRVYSQGGRIWTY